LRTAKTDESHSAACVRPTAADAELILNTHTHSERSSKTKCV